MCHLLGWHVLTGKGYASSNEGVINGSPFGNGRPQSASLQDSFGPRQFPALVVETLSGKIRYENLGAIRPTDRRGSVAPRRPVVRLSKSRQTGQISKPTSKRPYSGTHILRSVFRVALGACFTRGRFVHSWIAKTSAAKGYQWNEFSRQSKCEIGCRQIDSNSATSRG